MRTLFYSITVMVMLLAFFSLKSLIRSHETQMNDQQFTLIELERIDFLFENVARDMSNIVDFSCTTTNSTLNVSILMPASAEEAHDSAIGYEDFLESNFPGADLEIEGLLDDLENGNKYSIVVAGKEIEINYNVPKIKFDLMDGANVTFEFQGYADSITFNPEHSGDIPFCLFTPNLANCTLKGQGATTGEIRLNSTGHQPAGWIQVQISGSNTVQIFYNQVDNNLIPWINTTLSFPSTGEPIVLNGAYLTYILESTNRTDAVKLCE